MKKAETDQKKSGNGIKIWGNRSTKWDFLSFWKKRKRIKKVETDHKFKETDQQIEIFKVLGESGNGSKIWGNQSKIWGKRSILKF